MRARYASLIAAFLFAAIVVVVQNTASGQASRSNRPPYLDPSLPAEQRANDLVSRMTLEEKIAQMQDNAPAIPRLGVPAYHWWSEALHGVARAGYATVFPQAIALAATWDTEHIYRVADVISTEARAKYNDALLRGPTSRYFGLTIWSPNINIFRDPRWGRGQETFGEDPYLTSRIGVAFVRGLQGSHAKYLKTVSTPKHYAVHSGPEVLRHTFNAPASLRDFADTYAPAFRATVVEGNAYSVMCAYNAVLGEPACASKLLLDTLRGKWDFRGYVVSDCGAITDIHRGHGFVPTVERASAAAVKAGTDLSCGREYTALAGAVREGLVTEHEIDVAVKRLFEARFRLGMFDPRELVPWSILTIADNDTQAHRELALETARKSIVLLKNDQGVLPLSAGKRTIAVVGPTADSLGVLLGNYSGTPSRYVTPLEGIRHRFPDARVIHAEGSSLTETSAAPIPRKFLRTGGADSQPGLRAEFFNNRNLEGAPVLVRIDPEVNYSWDSSAPAPTVKAEEFSVRWSGEIIPPSDGEYLIGGSANDGFRVYLDGKMIVEDWGVHSERALTASVQLERDRAYAIRMEYFQARGGSAARLMWTPPNLLAEAVKAAREADVVVAVVGITAGLEGEEMDTNSPGFFGGDRVDLELPRPQQQLLEALHATGKPLIVVLTSGSALAINWAQEHAHAVLALWYPGEEGGAALADVLSGDYNPAGRLPVTFYKSVAQLPPFQNYSMNGRTYRYFGGQPLYPFGFGLSYTKFSYGPASVDRKEVSAGGSVTVSVDVKNTGSRAGEEVVQLYLRQPAIEGAPLRALQGFRRIALMPGEQKTVRLPIGEREMSLVDKDGIRRVVPGIVELWVGGGQPIEMPWLPAPQGSRAQFRITTASQLKD